MAWKHQSRKRGSWNDDYGSQTNGKGHSDGSGDGVEGVHMVLVCGGAVPVITLDSACVFYENAAWMLQRALGSDSKADALFEYLEDPNIVNECLELGFAREELGVAGLRQPEHQHVRAVGTTGKRSVMFAIVVALAMQDDDSLHGLYRDLQHYELDAAFATFLKMAAMTNSVGQENAEPPELPDGVDFDIVCGDVPVVSLDSASVLHMNASWVLQAALASTGKADSLYEYCTDGKVLGECKKRLGLTYQEVGLARLKQKGLKHIKAVGTAGKRSIMIALAVAVVLHGSAASTMEEDIQKCDTGGLWQALRYLLSAAQAMHGTSGNGDNRSSWQGDAGGSGNAKRKRGGNELDSKEWSSWGGDSSSQSSWNGKKKKGAWTGAGDNQEPLDQQWDNYWGA